jgi:ParB-like chromosome segregation protein Spo0J
MSEKMESHRFCEIFPVADESTLQDMANSISQHGLQEDIVTYEGKILDGRSRYSACLIAGVEPIFEEFSGDDALQYVITKNLHRRHLTASQRAFVAYNVYSLLKERDASVTMEMVAKQFSIGERTMRDVGMIKTSASESVQTAVRDGEMRVGKAIKAIEQAQNETDIAFANATPEQQFHERVLSGKFDSRRWKKNIDEIQSSIATIERLPELYHDCFELLKTLDQQALLITLCNIYFEAIKKTNAKLQQKHKPDDFNEIKQFFADIRKKYFAEFENDFGTGNEVEWNESSQNKFINICDKCIQEMEKIRRKLMSQQSSLVE